LRGRETLGTISVKLEDKDYTLAKIDYSNGYYIYELDCVALNLNILISGQSIQFYLDGMFFPQRIFSDDVNYNHVNDCVSKNYLTTKEGEISYSVYMLET
jgi:hypothetical protein